MKDTLKIPRRVAKTRLWINRQFTTIDADLEKHEEKGSDTPQMTWSFPIPRRIMRRYAVSRDEIVAITRRIIPERWYDLRITTVTVSGATGAAVLTIAFNDLP